MPPALLQPQGTRTAAMASIRPSCPPPRTPTRAVRGSAPGLLLATAEREGKQSDTFAEGLAPITRRVADGVRTRRWWVCHARSWAPRGCPTHKTQRHSARARAAACALRQVSKAGWQLGDSTAQRPLCAPGSS